MFKYELEQLVYYIKDNKLHSANVLARRVVENSKPHWARDADTRHLYAPWGESGIEYRTCHGFYKEDKLYASKEDLAAALIA